MGAFRAQPSIVLHTPRTANLISVNWCIAVIVIYSRSRNPPPLWDLNLGKLCYLVPVNHPPYPTSLNTHCEDPSMAYSSAIPRQLAPTVGQEALQALQRARTKIFAGIGETIAIGRVLFSGNVPIVPPDEFWIPVKMNPTRCSIVPIGDIHLFIGETDSGTSSLGVGGASRPTRTVYGQDTFTEGSMSDLSSEFAGKDRKNSRPTQTAPVQDIKVEDHCKSVGFARASGQQRSKFVGVVTIFDLARYVQREGEDPRDYLARWLRIRADLDHYPNDDAIYHFVEGLDHGTLLQHSLRRQQVSGRLTLEGMVNTVNNYAEAKAAAQTTLALIDGAPPIQPPPPPAAIVAAAPPPPVIVGPV